MKINVAITIQSYCVQCELNVYKDETISVLIDHIITRVFIDNIWYIVGTKCLPCYKLNRRRNRNLLWNNSITFIPMVYSFES